MPKQKNLFLELEKANKIESLLILKIVKVGIKITRVVKGMWKVCNGYTDLLLPIFSVKEMMDMI